MGVGHHGAVLGGYRGAGQVSHQSVSKPYQGEHRSTTQSKRLSELELLLLLILLTVFMEPGEFLLMDLFSMDKIKTVMIWLLSLFIISILNIQYLYWHLFVLPLIPFVDTAITI